MIKFLVFVVLSLGALVGCHELTRREQQNIKDTAGTVGSLFGVPRIATEGITALVLMALSHMHGQRHGRRCERRTHSAAQKPVAS